MSLATRCTSCGTIFRVVQDQLKVSEGWVRCGRCQEVFSALEGLFDLEREAPPQRNDAKPSATDTPSAQAAAGTDDATESPNGEATDFDPFIGEASHERHAQALPSTHETDAIESRFLTQGRGPSAGSPSSDEPDDDGFYAARFEPDAADERPSALSEPDAAPAPTSLAARWRASRDSRDAARASSMLEPSFDGPSVAADTEEQAVAAGPSYLGIEAPAPPPRPAAMAAWGVGAALLVAALLGQVAHQFRDVFATQWPQSRGALLAMCEWTGCTVGPLRRLAAVTVEDSGLTQVQGAEAYRLSVTLHNRSAFEVAVPSIDLSLTDGSGALVSRRMLAPRDFSGGPSAGAGGVLTLAPGSEAQLQALLAARGTRITGYTVELFYP